MNDTPFRGSRPGLAAARTLPHVDLSPAGLTADLPEEIPGLARDDGILHGYAPKRVSFKGVVVSVLDGVGQRHADLAIAVDGVSDNHAVVGCQINWGAVAPQFCRWCEGDRVTFTVTLSEGQSKAKLHGLIGREVTPVESADVLRTNLVGCDWAGCARRRCRRRIGALGGGSCHPRETQG